MRSFSARVAVAQVKVAAAGPANGGGSATTERRVGHAGQARVRIGRMTALVFATFAVRMRWPDDVRNP
jgi:hypothetical protein